MTKTELKVKAREYIESLDVYKEEWYGPHREVAHDFIHQFLKHIGVELDEFDYNSLKFKGDQ